jgi:hypothetical protein
VHEGNRGEGRVSAVRFGGSGGGGGYGPGVGTGEAAGWDRARRLGIREGGESQAGGVARCVGHDRVPGAVLSVAACGCRFGLGPNS